MKFIHLSDLHIGQGHNIERMDYIASQIIAARNNNTIEANHIVITGDKENMEFQ